MNVTKKFESDEAEAEVQVAYEAAQERERKMEVMYKALLAVGELAVEYGNQEILNMLFPVGMRVSKEYGAATTAKLEAYRAWRG